MCARAHTHTEGGQQRERDRQERDWGGANTERGRQREMVGADKERGRQREGGWGETENTHRGRETDTESGRQTERDGENKLNKPTLI